MAAVYASPLERARETAAPIGKRLGLKVAIEKGLIEMDFGEWTGAELKALRKLPEWNAVQRYPSGFQFPGGEAFSAMRARIAATVATLCRRHPGEAIVAVSHADAIKAAVSRRPRHPPRPVPAHRRLALLGDRHQLLPDRTRRAGGQLDRRPRRPAPLVNR